MKTVQKKVLAAIEASEFDALLAFGPDKPYRLALLAGSEAYVTQEGDRLIHLPVALTLDRNAPNPFRPSTRIRFGQVAEVYCSHKFVLETECGGGRHFRLLRLHRLLSLRRQVPERDGPKRLRKSDQRLEVFGNHQRADHGRSTLKCAIEFFRLEVPHLDGSLLTP